MVGRVVVRDGAGVVGVVPGVGVVVVVVVGVVGAVIVGDCVVVVPVGVTVWRGLKRKMYAAVPASPRSTTSRTTTTTNPPRRRGCGRDIVKDGVICGATGRTDCKGTAGIPGYRGLAGGGKMGEVPFGMCKNLEEATFVEVVGTCRQEHALQGRVVSTGDTERLDIHQAEVLFNAFQEGP